MSKKRTKASERKRKKRRKEMEEKARRPKGKEKPQSKSGNAPTYLDIPPEDLKAIIERARTSPLSEGDYEKLTATVDTLTFLTQELQVKGTSIRRLRKMLFGSTTEKTSKVIGEQKPKKDEKEGSESLQQGSTKDSAKKKSKKKRKGHGRNGADDYTGAEKVSVAHESLNNGDRCPKCLKGKVYNMAEPATMVRVTGMAPLQATVYERQRLRCNLCGEVFTAKSPKGVGEKKYGETAAAMIGLLKYGCGLPFNRMERLERGFGIPLPASTQWDVVENAEKKLVVPFEELIRQAAQGKVLHNDDTTIKILEMMAEASGKKPDTESDKRTGMFTTGVISTGEGYRIALFFSGRQHAGENLADVLKKRASELGAPIQMCDGLSRNTAGDFDSILANCMAHARRKFVDVSYNFPKKVKHVLEQLREVYKNDATTHKENMSPEQRLKFHKAHSKTIMDALESWLKKQSDEHLVEPNSGLGEAIKYMTGHWNELTLFLRVAGAPLDNNCCERALKKAILHRKNSLFYKTKNGARVGDTYMSLIHTCEINDIDPFDYLVALQLHGNDIAKSPENWMPWNYQVNLKNLKSSGPSPPSSPNIFH